MLTMKALAVVEAMLNEPLPNQDLNELENFIACTDVDLLIYHARELERYPSQASYHARWIAFYRHKIAVAYAQGLHASWPAGPDWGTSNEA